MISKLLSSFPAVTFAVIASSYVLASDEDVTLLTVSSTVKFESVITFPSESVIV